MAPGSYYSFRNTAVYQSRLINFIAWMACLSVLLSNLLQTVNAQNGNSTDPVQNMCYRWYHQSVVKGAKLYIDGGIETYMPYSYDGSYDHVPRLVGYNNKTIIVNMESDWNWQKNISETTISKVANPNTGTSPPILYEGALYQGLTSSTKIYIYGGTAFYPNAFSVGPESAQYPLWSWDTASRQWGQYDLDTTSEGIVSGTPSGGAWTEALDQGLAFYLSGKIDNGSYQGNDLSSRTMPIGGMVVLNLTESGPLVQNISTETLFEGGARLRGGMQYIPQYGERGIILAVGGGSASAADNTSWGSLVPLDIIDIFDIKSLNSANEGVWYQQKTSGSAPQPRSDFCLVTVAAPDNSSQQVYLYGGRNETTVFDDVYALSLPSFIWTQVYFHGQSPRYGHTCHLVAEREMLTVGGQKWFNVTQDCDWESKGVAIYDLPTLTWGSVYNANPGPYEIPQLVYTAIGGGPDGNATKQTPSGGWSSQALESLFATKRSGNFSSPSSTSSVPTSTLSGGAIAGIVVGALAGVCFFASSVFLVLRLRWRHHRRQKQLRQRQDTYINHAKDTELAAVAGRRSEL